MPKAPRRADGRRASVLRLADDLVTQLKEICRRASDSGSPIPVDLRRALKRARRLSAMISTDHEAGLRWEKVWEAIAYVVAIAKMIHGLLNCTQLRDHLVESWDYHKAVAHRRGDIADPPRRDAWRVAQLPVPGGEWAEAAKLASAAAGIPSAVHTLASPRA